MHWHTECVMRMVFRSWSLAVQMLVRERLEARCEELTTLATMKKHQLVETAVTELFWSRDQAERETVGQFRLAFAGAPPRGGRTSAEATAAPERPRKSKREERLRVRVQGNREAVRGQLERICRALRFQISKVMQECSLWNTTSAGTKLRLRAMDLLRERKTVKVSWWGRPWARSK